MRLELSILFTTVVDFNSRLEVGGQFTLKNSIIPQIDLFTGPVFEEICRQYLWRASLSGKLPFSPTHIGNWWNANEEIDLIALRDVGALLVECKWTTKPLGMDILEDLERKAAVVKSELGNREIFFALCARSGFTSHVIAELEQRQDLFLFDLPTILE